MVHLHVRELGPLGRERGNVVAGSDIAVWDGSVDWSLVGIVPVASRNVVALERMHVVPCIKELAVRNQTPTSGTARVNHPRAGWDTRQECERTQHQPQ